MFDQGFDTLVLELVFKYSSQIRLNEKYDVRRKLFETISLSQKMALYPI